LLLRNYSSNKANSAEAKSHALDLQLQGLLSKGKKKDVKNIL